MKNSYEAYGYYITTDPQFQNKRYGVTPELAGQLKTLVLESQDKKNNKIIDKLTQLIIQNPTIPILKKYLSVAYNVHGNHDKAVEVNKWLVAGHPDYLFAKLNQANSFIEEGTPEKVPELLGQAMEIKLLYPDRDTFHIGEVTEFIKVAIRYYIAIDDLELAQNRLDLLTEVYPDHPEIEKIQKRLSALVVKKAIERIEEWQKMRIAPEQLKPLHRRDHTKPPQFNHPETAILYQYGFDISHEKLREILSLPRPSVIEDIETILLDAELRYDYFSEIDIVVETHSFVIHALLLLKELKAEESLPKILAFMSNEHEFLDFWLEDHKTETIWQCFYTLALNNPRLLEQHLLKPYVDTFGKVAVSQALCQMVIHHPEKRDEIAAIYSEVLVRFSEASLDENLIDSELLGFIVGHIIDCDLTELLPVIKNLFDKKYVSLDINGDYQSVEDDFSMQSERNYKKDISAIFDFYDDIQSPQQASEVSVLNKNTFDRLESISKI